MGYTSYTIENKGFFRLQIGLHTGLHGLHGLQNWLKTNIL